MKRSENNYILYIIRTTTQISAQIKRSYKTQLVSFVNDLTKTNDHGKQTDVILMNIAKAFDTVP